MNEIDFKAIRTEIEHIAGFDGGRKFATITETPDGGLQIHDGKQRHAFDGERLNGLPEDAVLTVRIVRQDVL